eukprot:5076920-Pleurochrysis_carterae.AAC.1
MTDTGDTARTLSLLEQAFLISRKKMTTLATTLESPTRSTATEPSSSPTSTRKHSGKCIAMKDVVQPDNGEQAYYDPEAAAAQRARWLAEESAAAAREAEREHYADE